jgi:hypothetical protein
MTEAAWWSNIEGGWWMGAILASIPLGVLFWVLYRYGFPKIHHVIDMVPVDDEIPAKISQAISRKVQSANFLNLSVRKAKALIRQLAREAICEAYSEHFPPKVYEVRNDRFGNPEWPDVSVHIANIVGVGTIATVECWIGHDFDDDRALEDVAVRVALKPEVIAFKRVVNAPPAKEPPEHWPTGGKPELKLAKSLNTRATAAPPPKPRPSPATRPGISRKT